MSVLIGDRDNLLPEVDRKWARDRLDDIRVIHTDHLIMAPGGCRSACP
jgi:hypothetical protein